MDCLIVIPARMASTRFPGKPLVDLCGKPMVQWVYERAVASGVGDEVVIATPDDEILSACESFGARAVLTSLSHPTGTDRIAEVAREISAAAYVNVQGDEPLVDPASIAACANNLLLDSSVEMGSVFEPCPEAEIDQPSTVKVVTDLAGFALYFSRHAIPYPRNARSAPVKKHVGLYAYRKEVLERFSTWSQTPLELAESLEQLRFMENGVRIKMAEGKGSALAIDEPHHADRVRELIESGAIIG